MVTIVYRMVTINYKIVTNDWVICQIFFGLFNAKTNQFKAAPRFYL